jgi:hypothetical protein
MEAARKLYHQLQNESRIEPWLDEESLIPGQNWREEIPRAVNSCDVFLICLSATSVTKEGYLQREIRYALDSAEEKPEGSIFIIPAKLEECEIPIRLRGWQWANLYQDNGYEKLIRALRLHAESLVAPTVEQQVRAVPSPTDETAVASPIKTVGEISNVAAKKTNVPRPVEPKRASFADLIGVGSAFLDWPKIFLFMIAHLTSSIFPIQGRGWEFVGSLLYDLFFIFSVILAFRKVRSTVEALILAAITFALIRNLLFGILFTEKFSVMLSARSFIWAAIYLAGLCYGIQVIRPLWIGFSLGAFAGSFLGVLTVSALFPSMPWGISPHSSLYLSFQELSYQITFLLIFLPGFYLLQKYRSKRRLIT